MPKLFDITHVLKIEKWLHNLSLVMVNQVYLCSSKSWNHQWLNLLDTKEFSEEKINFVTFI